MCQVGWKHKKQTVAHRHHDLICILGREFSDWRSDDAGLRSWIVKVNRIRSGIRMNIVYATQEIVRMAMNRVRRSACVDIGPTTCNLNRVMADFQKLKYSLRGTINARNEVPKLFAIVKILP